MKRSGWIVAAVFVLVGVGPLTAHAGIWEAVFQGLDYAATPSGSPLQTTGDGTRVNGARQGRLRIVPNGLLDGGRGYRLEFDRVFGVDARGRPETLSLAGVADLTLNGGVQVTAGFSTPREPLYFGNFDFNINNLNYDFATRLGAQDASLVGTLDGTGNLDINVFGFYDLTLQLDNTNSQLTLEGAAVEDTVDTNFNVGPISIKGNVFVDGVLAALANIGGIRATDLENLFPDSPIDQLNDEIVDAARQRQVGGNLVAGENAALLLDAVVGQDAGSGQQLIEALLAAENPSASADGAARDATVDAIPEPASCLLLLIGAALRRRRA